MEFASTPDPPYYVAVITVRRTADDEGYLAAADQMYELATSQRGFIGMEWVSDPGERAGITCSYWTDEEAVAEWKMQADHLAIQRLGQERWYEAYTVRVALVERQYSWQRPG
jgi:heme-degrading monooxygenase HmoA